jgi:hypothetical protein
MINEILYNLKDINVSPFFIPINYVIDQKHLTEDYQCMIKSHLPYDPLQCSNCDSLICKSCIQEQQNNNCCLHCNEQINLKELSRLAKLTLDKFTLKCLNQSCNSPIKYENYLMHYIHCEYTPREAICTGCNTVIKTTNGLREINEHNKNCNLKELCKFCFKIIFYKDVDEHLKECEERQVHCPYCDEFPFFSYRFTLD